MTLQQKFRRSNQIMVISFLICLSVFTLFFIDKEHLVSSITFQDSFQVLVASIVSLFVIIFALFYLPMLLVVKLTFRLPTFSINKPKNYETHIFTDISINTSSIYQKLCVYRC